MVLIRRRFRRRTFLGTMSCLPIIFLLNKSVEGKKEGERKGARKEWSERGGSERERKQTKDLRGLAMGVDIDLRELVHGREGGIGTGGISTRA